MASHAVNDRTEENTARRGAMRTPSTQEGRSRRAAHAVTDTNAGEDGPQKLFTLPDREATWVHNIITVVGVR